MSSTESPRSSSYDLEEKGAGWVFFAVSMLALAGIVGLINRIDTATPLARCSTRRLEI